ncbi:hypothetical protein [Chitinophaga agri]|uniref:Uncharacterized protein n=1 Tax=Chitinophaga agri TaxID=2703787 RepID=A0A6B9ZMP5_9BACT|nr:hypothetical protein [Chitinophaga agri]QHS62901.1 hypothetical protein GWR21_25950 [Chitinophaga agri]
MINNDPKTKDPKKNNEDAAIQPDPETLGPEPQEHMEGPISSIMKKLEELGDDNFGESDEEVKEKQKKSGNPEKQDND